MTATLQQSEPDSHFESLCQTLFSDWITGKMPLHEVVKVLDTLGKKADESKQYVHQGRIEHIRGRVYQDAGDINRSIQHYDKARRFYVKANNRRLTAIIDLNQGENYREKGDFVRALSLYQQAYKIAGEAEDPDTQTYARGNMGWAWYGLGDYEQAQRAFEEAYNTASTIPDEKERCGTIAEQLYGMAMVSLSRQEWLIAWHLGCEALEQAQKSDENRELGYAWRTLGDALTLLRIRPIHSQSITLPSSTDDYYANAISAFKAISAEVEIARTLFAQAKSLVKRGNAGKASPLFRESIVIFTRLNLVHEAMKVAEVQFRIGNH